MLDALKAAGALAGLMKNKEAIKQAAERMKKRLGEVRASGGSGGGAVRAVVSGDLRVISITMDPPVLAGLASGDAKAREMVEALIAEAVNNAIDIAKVMSQREMAKEAEALGLPLGAMGGLESLAGGT